MRINNVIINIVMIVTSSKFVQYTESNYDWNT